MNHIKLREQLIILDIELRTKILELSITKAVEMTGLKYQDIQAYLKGRRKWSYEKILNITDKLFKLME